MREQASERREQEPQEQRQARLQSAAENTQQRRNSIRVRYNELTSR